MRFEQSGAAFPFVLESGTEIYEEGMTLRDYFAGQALTGLLSCDDGRAYPKVAKDAYLYADAVLVARELP